MSSSAISSQNVIVRVATANGASKTITGATAANPVVITSAAHGLANGSVVYIASVVGMVELNGRTFVIANQATNTFELKGVDGSAYTAYSSGGTALPKTMTEVVNCRSASLFEGTTPEIDITNMRSTAREYLLDIPDRGTGSLTIDIDTSDPGQARLKALHLLTTAESFTVTDRNSKATAFTAFVQSYPVNMGVGQTIQGSVGLRVTGQEAWFA